MRKCLLESQSLGRLNGSVVTVYIQLDNLTMKLIAEKGETTEVELELPITIFQTVCELIDKEKVQTWKRTGSLTI